MYVGAYRAVVFIHSARAGSTRRWSDCSPATVHDVTVYGRRDHHRYDYTFFAVFFCTADR